MWRLLYPLRYFALRNREKWLLDGVPTLLLTILISVPYLLLPGAPFFGGGGFLDKILGLVSALTGFYVAALVAAATFAHPDLDKVIAVGAITVRARNADGEVVDEPLTRREFACTVFGYLAFASLVMSILAAMSVTLAGPLTHALHQLVANAAVRWELVRHLSRGVGLVACSLVLSHITVVTALGLYYLMDRLHAREPVVVATKQNRRDAA